MGKCVHCVPLEVSASSMPKKVFLYLHANLWMVPDSSYGNGHHGVDCEPEDCDVYLMTHVMF